MNRHLNLFCLLAAGLMCASHLNAQRFEGALLFGANASQISRDDLNGYHQLGINAGARVVARLDNVWSIGPELLFSQYGSRRQNNSINISDFESFRFNTIEVPLMAYWKDWRITAEAGVSYWRLINYEIIDIAGENVSEDFELRENILNLQLGATYYISDRLGINFRYSRNLTRLDTDNNPNTFNWRNYALTFRFVYLLSSDFGLPDKPDEEFDDTPRYRPRSRR
ncbi:MAG: porin family protein [Bacteroidota bacterium]